MQTRSVTIKGKRRSVVAPQIDWEMIDRLAIKEGRSSSAMVRILLQRALDQKARRRASGSSPSKPKRGSS